MNFLFNNNYSVSVNKLTQWRTYAGLIEGLPSEKTNQRNIQELVNTYKNSKDDRGYCLIEPIQTEKIIGFKDNKITYMSLPEITCIAHLFSRAPLPIYPDDFGSSLVLIWFQNEYCLPLNPAIEEQIKQIDWNNYAQGYDF